MSILTNTERKLLTLALDPSAAVGEVENSSLMFVASLRKRNMDAYTFLASLSEGSEDNLGTCRMPFGKHKGKMLREIPIDYLLWARRDLKDGSAKTLIQEYLKKKGL